MSYESELIVDQIISDLQSRPDDFECTRYTLTDKKTGFIYEIFFVGEIGIKEPYQFNFGFFQSRRFKSALKKWKAADVIKRSNKQVNQ